MPVRAGIAVATFGVWYLLTMRNASGNTSWEHHPFAGPFIMVKESLSESHSAGDWALALLVWAFFLAFPVYWVASGKVWAAIVAVVLCGVTILMSHMAAVSASC